MYQDTCTCIIQRMLIAQLRVSHYTLDDKTNPTDIRMMMRVLPGTTLYVLYVTPTFQRTTLQR